MKNTPSGFEIMILSIASLSFNILQSQFRSSDDFSVLRSVDLYELRNVVRKTQKLFNQKSILAFFDDFLIVINVEKREIRCKKGCTCRNKKPNKLAEFVHFLQVNMLWKALFVNINVIKVILILYCLGNCKSQKS